jgi:hypothetical protein
VSLKGKFDGRGKVPPAGAGAVFVFCHALGMAPYRENYNRQ